MGAFKASPVVLKKIPYPVPSGWYHGKIVDSRMANQKKGGEALVLRWKVVGNNIEGERYVEQWFPDWNKEWDTDTNSSHRKFNEVMKATSRDVKEYISEIHGGKASFGIIVDAERHEDRELATYHGFRKIDEEHEGAFEIGLGLSCLGRVTTR